MKYLFIFFVFIFKFHSFEITITHECQCNQMLTKVDCERNDECLWDIKEKICNKHEKLRENSKPINNQTSIPEIPLQRDIIQASSLYCSLFLDNQLCSKSYPCASFNQTCVHFTTCTAYTFTTDSDCLNISQRCISDGTQCIEKMDCEFFKLQEACKINREGKYCFWNKSDTINQKCEVINKCSLLPTILSTDEECRSQLPQCTVKIEGGCIESGENCSDQISEIFCVTNRQRNISCIWKENQCFDRTCEDASQSLISDSDCKNFLSICTTKQDGGCIQRQFCENAQIEAACISDINDNLCFWNGNQCQDKICKNAPKSFNTNESCQEIQSICITTGNGCIENTGCEAAIIQQACDKTLTGILCHWDGSQCVIKTCENAGSLYIGHKACNDFLPNCTAKVNELSGCMLISCLSAPINNNTNELCNEYLPNHNCITKNEGGCKVNTSCENIDIEIACIKDVNNKDCYWYNGQCKVRICKNAPKIFTTHEQCQNYSYQCTAINSECVDMHCETIQYQEYCIIDLYKNPCYYHNTCRLKQCVFADQAIQNHEDCQKYLDTCTKDNSGQGCMNLPMECSSILIQKACKITLSGEICGWDGNNCINYNCYTATSDFDSTEKCKQYKDGCVVNNDLNGCMDLPNNCQDRKQKDNCEIENDFDIKCQWDEISSFCLDIKCENAHLISLLNNVSQEGCWNFYGLNCIINNSYDKCIGRPNICDGIAEMACIWEDVLIDNSKCYWDVASQTCKVYACSSITFQQNQMIDHQFCNVIMSKCTVNDKLIGCIDLAKCTDYLVQEQCVVDQNNWPCTWDQQACHYKICEIAPENSNFDNDRKCAKYSNQCTINQTKCSLRKTNCHDYSDQISCEQNTLNQRQQCLWQLQDQTCIEQQFNCSIMQGTYLNPQYCNQINTNCSVDRSQTQCIVDQLLCENYITQENCLWASQDSYCEWSNSKCVADCSKFTNSYLDFEYCYKRSQNCTVKLDGSACVYMGAKCSNNPLTSCTYAKDGNFCYVKKGTPNTCIAKTTVLQSANCQTITGTRLTAFYCKKISNNNCSVNAAFNTCIAAKLNCSDYTGAGNCNFSKNGQCTLKNGVCKNLIQDEFVCDNIQLYGYTIYTDYLCQMKDASCIAKSDKTGCVKGNITQAFCQSFSGINLTDNYCASQSISCIANKSKTQCIEYKNQCEEYSLEDCYIAISDGECIIENDQCVQKQCNNAPITIKTMDECLGYSQNCLLRQGGCQQRENCEQYYVENACFFDYDGKECLWNPQNQQCVYKLCENAENSIYFDTVEECSKVGDCTVNFNSDSIGGCISLTSCDQYFIEEQCKIDHQGEICIWSSYYQMCSYKQCLTAPMELNNHQLCMVYHPNCTVNIIDSKPQGCMELQLCDQYISEEQCVISSMKDENNKNIVCGWNGYSCANKSCSTAQIDENTPILCSSYFPGCTVNETNDGCIEIPLQCEIMTKQQCYYGSVDSNNKKCMWLKDQQICVTKTCENAIHADSNQQCEDHLQYCIDKIKIFQRFLNKFILKNHLSNAQTPFRCLSGQAHQCTDFTYQTDFECRSVIPNIDCTTNGQNCVLRTSCSDVLNKAGCTFDNQGFDCEWVTHKKDQSYCTLKTCETAPKSLRTEEACKTYYPFSDGNICTTKRNGGCTIKQSCTQLTIEAICNIDAQGKQCVWDIDAQQCRFPKCKDIKGNTIEECQVQNNNCTLGLNGRCTEMTICEYIKIKQACVLGTNGPCIWVDEYILDDKSKGACFLYDSCQSLRWKTNEQCQLISPNCITDGLKCVGISLCKNTNINGGCKYGTDGLCVQTPQDINSTNLICKKFTICNEVYYLNHQQCLRANPNCTTDGIKGCIPLNQCKMYLYEDSCHINHIGIQKDGKGSIITTGKCIWDDIYKQCRDESCSDYNFKTERECQSILKNCTSDGKQCVIKSKCTDYLTERACKNVGGIDGLCIWIPPTALLKGSCRIQTCTEIENGISTQICSIFPMCISDGQNCINKVECSSYQTKTACYQNGINEVCIWLNDNVGRCQKMKSCNDGKNYQNCKQASDRCYWNLESNNCMEHSCETFQVQEQKCTYFFTWDKKKYNICSIQNDICVPTDIVNIKEESCYQLSGRLYSWDPFSSQCSRCDKIKQNEIPKNTNIDITVNAGLILSLCLQMILFNFYGI